jgi:hypothetical protein
MRLSSFGGMNMKIIKDGYSHSVSDALKYVCDGNDYDVGQLEAIKYTVDNGIEKLGEIVELLHKKGLITDDEIKELLGSWRFDFKNEE